MKAHAATNASNAVPNFDIVFKKRDEALKSQGAEQASQIAIVIKQSEALQTLREVFGTVEEPLTYYTRS